MLVIIKLLERFQECLGFQLVNTFFKKMKTLIIKHISVEFFAVRLLLKFVNKSHILKCMEDDVSLNLFLRNFNGHIKAFNEELGILRNGLSPFFIILIHFF